MSWNGGGRTRRTRPDPEGQVQKRQRTGDGREREERVVDVYDSADHLKPDPNPGTQQDAVQQSLTQSQNGSKTNC